MKILNFTFLLLLGCIGTTYAQKAPFKFGKVEKADLLSNIFKPDTTASAVVLYDYGYFNFYDYQSEHARILRIKILKEEGCIWGNLSFKLNYKPDIIGITYNLKDGEIVETKLKKESITRTLIFENYYETNLSMPNVKVGSIIDIKINDIGIPNEWDFQWEIPVVYSELYVEPFNFQKYSRNYFGLIPLDVNTNNQWILNNAPAFKSEPFMTSSKNFRTRIEFDLEAFSSKSYSRVESFNGNLHQEVQRGSYIPYTTSWENIRDLLYGVQKIPKYNYLATLYELFGEALENDSYVMEVVESIKLNSLSLNETIKAAHEYAKQISWDKTNRFLATGNNLNNAFKEGKGNSAEINLALVQLLRKLGLDAGPVVLSTRDNGRLSEFHPSINKLNYVIAAVFTEKDTILLDATEKNCPYYLLPMRALNGQGRFMDKKRTGWVSLEAQKKDKQMVVFDLSVEEDMSLKGKLDYSRGDYAALDFRNNYEEFNSNDEYLTHFKEGKRGLKIVSHKIDNLDSLYKMVKEVFEVEINNAITEIDGDLYIAPLLFEQMKENPFKISERNYPIDFGYLHDKTIIVNYRFPKGYSVVNLPESTILQLPGNAAVLSCKSTVTEGKITVIYKITINKNLFVPAEYADLREFYNQIVTKSAEPIVLKKI